MKSKKMMSLLTATAVSGGIITAAVVTPSVVAAAESMADQQQPAYAPLIGSTENLISFSSPESETELREGTQFQLEDGADYLVSEGIYVTVKEDGKVAFAQWNGPGAVEVPASGTTITVPLTVVYPGGSEEVVRAELTLTPPQVQGFDVAYAAAAVEQGATTILHPADEEVTGPIHLQLRVSYPDGTSELATTMIEVIAPALPQPEVIDPTPPQVDDPGIIYPVGAITQGALATISPDDSQLPPGTVITLIDDSQLQDLISAGWGIHVGDENVLFYTAPFDAEGPAIVNLLVDYPDGTQSETTAAIHVNASNLAGDHDVSYPDTAILAGGSAILTPVTTDLPAGTTITLVEDTALEAARQAGWNLSINDTGRIALSTQESIVDGRNVVNILISYPDGTSEVTAVGLLVLPEPTPEEEAPTKVHPVPWSSWGFFGSS